MENRESQSIQIFVFLKEYCYEKKYDLLWGCPFLKSEKSYNEYWDCPEKHIDDALIHHDQKNTCLLMKSPTLWNTSSKGVYESIKQEYHENWLSVGVNPKKNKQCLDLTKFILGEI